jgi:hypothetical protein
VDGDLPSLAAAGCSPTSSIRTRYQPGVMMVPRSRSRSEYETTGIVCYPWKDLLVVMGVTFDALGTIL